MATIELLYVIVKYFNWLVLEVPVTLTLTLLSVVSHLLSFSEAIMLYPSSCHPVSSSRYEPQGGIEAISPANSPAQREEKNEGPFPSEKSSQPPSGEPLTCTHFII